MGEVAMPRPAGDATGTNTSTAEVSAAHGSSEVSATDAAAEVAATAAVTASAACRRVGRKRRAAQRHRQNDGGGSLDRRFPRILHCSSLLCEMVSATAADALRPNAMPGDECIWHDDKRLLGLAAAIARRHGLSYSFVSHGARAANTLVLSTSSRTLSALRSQRPRAGQVAKLDHSAGCASAPSAVCCRLRWKIQVCSLSK
jgi:hypothetical protein